VSRSAEFRVASDSFEAYLPTQTDSTVIPMDSERMPEEMSINPREILIRIVGSAAGFADRAKTSTGLYFVITQNRASMNPIRKNGDKD
jgi:hypothetical protein